MLGEKAMSMKISPSILSADFAKMGEIKAVGSRLGTLRRYGRSFLPKYHVRHSYDKGYQKVYRPAA